MEHLDTAVSASKVRALYAGHAASFSLEKGATLTDLIDRLDDAGGWGAGSPTAIFLQFDTPRSH